MVTTCHNSTSNLAAQSHEHMQIEFEAVYHLATAGSSSWSVLAHNVRIHVKLSPGSNQPKLFMVKIDARVAEPYAYIEQTVWLVPTTAGIYSGNVPLPLYISGGSDGKTYNYKQIFQFYRLSTDFREDEFTPVPSDELIDPINHTNRFEADLFKATPYAYKDMGEWNSI